jgi:carboxymethylenebutenolidase
LVGHLDELASVTVPLAIHYGTEDEHCGPEAEGIMAATPSARELTVRLYLEADHAFANQFRPM